MATAGRLYVGKQLFVGPTFPIPALNPVGFGIGPALTPGSAYFSGPTYMGHASGCFGDAIKLTPWESFYKDIILLVFSISIYFLNNNLKNQVGLFYIKIFDDKVFRNGEEY